MREAAVEAAFHDKVRRILDGESYKVAPVHAGIPDRLVLLPRGRVYLVELKADGGQLRPVQEVWHGRAAELGTWVVVLHGTAEVDAWVENRRHDCRFCNWPTVTCEADGGCCIDCSVRGEDSAHALP